MFSHDIDLTKLAEKASNPKICRHDQSRLALAFATLRNGCGYRTSLGLKRTDWANDPEQIRKYENEGMELAWCPEGYHAFDKDHNLIRLLTVKVSPSNDTILSDLRTAVAAVGLKCSVDSTNKTVTVSSTTA